MTVTVNHDTKVYNGEEQSVSGFTTDAGGKDIHVALKDGHKLSLPRRRGSLRHRD